MRGVHYSAVVAVLTIVLSRNAAAQSHNPPSTFGTLSGEAVVKHRATGTFEVTVLPLEADSTDTGGFGRLSIDKTFRGDLTGTSRGQMVAAMTAVEGSGAYVALERVTATLQERTGSFILQHNGTMKGGSYEMRITVVPDSGTDELAGLAGTFKIIIEGKKHSYEFEYTLGG
jgi:hypothetical protein